MKIIHLTIVFLMMASRVAMREHSRQPRLFDLFGSDICFTAAGGPVGSCRNPFSCLTGGTFNGEGQCLNPFGGICCETHINCNTITAEEVVYWESNNYPADNNNPGQCSLTVKPVGNICFLWVIVDDLNLPTGVVNACQGDILTIFNQQQGNGVPICGPLTGFNLFINTLANTFGFITFSRPITFVLSLRTVPYKFRMRIIQVNCNSVTPFSTITGATTIPSGRKKRHTSQPLSNGTFPPEDHDFLEHNEIHDLWRPRNTKIKPRGEYKQQVADEIRQVADPTKLWTKTTTTNGFELPLYFSKSPSNIFSQFVETRKKSTPLIPSVGATRSANELNDLSKYPWLGFMVLSNAVDQIFLCGVSLISRRHVATAAQCFLKKGYGTTYNAYIYFMTAHLNALNIDQIMKGVGGIRPKKVTIHPMVDTQALMYDFAIVELDRELPYPFLPLYSGTGAVDGGVVKMFAYELPTDGSQSSAAYLEVTLISTQSCKNYFGVLSKLGSSRVSVVKDHMQCILLPGDFESPIVVPGFPLVINDAGTPKLLGIMSGQDLITKSHEFPLVASLVSSFLNFIDVATTDLATSMRT